MMWPDDATELSNLFKINTATNALELNVPVGEIKMIQNDGGGILGFEVDVASTQQVTIGLEEQQCPDPCP